MDYNAVIYEPRSAFQPKLYTVQQRLNFQSVKKQRVTARNLFARRRKCPPPRLSRDLNRIFNYEESVARNLPRIKYIPRPVHRSLACCRQGRKRCGITRDRESWFVYEYLSETFERSFIADDSYLPALRRERIYPKNVSRTCLVCAHLGDNDIPRSMSNARRSAALLSDRGLFSGVHVAQMRPHQLRHVRRD